MDKNGKINKKNTFIALAIIAALAATGIIMTKCSTGEAPPDFDPTKYDSQTE